MGVKTLKWGAAEERPRAGAVVRPLGRSLGSFLAGRSKFTARARLLRGGYGGYGDR